MKYDIYARSFLCYGENEAYSRFLAYLVRNSVSHIILIYMYVMIIPHTRTWKPFVIINVCTPIEYNMGDINITLGVKLQCVWSAS